MVKPKRGILLAKTYLAKLEPGAGETVMMTCDKRRQQHPDTQRAMRLGLGIGEGEGRTAG